MVYFWVFCPVLLICVSVLCHHHTTSLVAQTVKHLPTMQETQVQSLGQEDILEKEMATHSSISCLEKSVDRRACWTTVLGISESRTWLSTHQMHLTLGHFFMHLSPRAFGKCSQFSSPYLSGKYLVDWGFPWSLHFSCEEVCWTGRLKNRDDDDRVASHCHCQETRVWKITLRTTHELTLPGLVY